MCRAGGGSGVGRRRARWVTCVGGVSFVFEAEAFSLSLAGACTVYRVETWFRGGWVSGAGCVERSSALVTSFFAQFSGCSISRTGSECLATIQCLWSCASESFETMMSHIAVRRNTACIYQVSPSLG